MRYRGSALGWLWSLLQPLATVGFFSVVFLTLFNVQAPPLGNGNGESYAAFLFCGLATWNLFASLQSLSITTMRSCERLFSKASFPIWTPVVGAQVVQVLQVLVEFAVVGVILALLRNVSWTWLLAVPIAGGLILFSAGVSLIVAALSTYWGDVREIVVTSLALLYFATPVLYPFDALSDGPHAIRWVVAVNPLSWYVGSMHSVLYSLSAPPAWLIGLLVLGGAVMFWVGMKVFGRLTVDLADRL